MRLVGVVHFLSSLFGEGFHCVLAVKQASVIEEKGEGFENGKNTIFSAWG